MNEMKGEGSIEIKVMYYCSAACEPCDNGVYAQAYDV